MYIFLRFFIRIRCLFSSGGEEGVVVAVVVGLGTVTASGVWSWDGEEADGSFEGG